MFPAGLPRTGRTSGRPRKCFPLAMYRHLLSQTSAYIYTYVPGTFGCVCPHRKQGGTWGEFGVAFAGAAFPGPPRGASARVKPTYMFHCNSHAHPRPHTAGLPCQAELEKRMNRPPPARTTINCSAPRNSYNVAPGNGNRARSSGMLVRTIPVVFTPCKQEPLFVGQRRHCGKSVLRRTKSNHLVVPVLCPNYIRPDPKCTSSEQRQHLHGPQTPRRDSGNVHAPRRFLQRTAPRGNLGNAPSAVPLARTKCESCGRHVGVDRQVRSREIHLAAGMAYISTNFNKFQHVMLIFVDFTNFNKFQQISTLNVEIC